MFLLQNFVVVLCFCSAFSICMFGGWCPITNYNSKGFEDALLFLVTKTSEKLSKELYPQGRWCELEQINSAYYQVVAGVNYNISVAVLATSCNIVDVSLKVFDKSLRREPSGLIRHKIRF